MKAILRLGAIISLAAPLPAFAQATFNLGTGTQTCTAFIQQYKDSPAATEADYYNWAQGYMSGMNMRGMLDHSREFVDLSGQMDAAAQKLFLRNFCGQNGASLYMDAVNALIQQLPPVSR